MKQIEIFIRGRRDVTCEELQKRVNEFCSKHSVDTVRVRSKTDDARMVIVVVYTTGVPII